MRFDDVYELLIALIMCMLIFNYMFQGAPFIGLMVVLICMVGVFYLVRGVIKAFFGHAPEEFWAGAAIILVMVVLFGGLPYVLAGLNAIILVAANIIGIIAGLITAI